MSIIFKLCSVNSHTRRKEKVGELESINTVILLAHSTCVSCFKRNEPVNFCVEFFSRKIYRRSIFHFLFKKRRRCICEKKKLSFSCFELLEIKQVWLISFDIQSIWITILFQRISQVNCISITFYRKLRKLVRIFVHDYSQRID